MTFDEWWEDPQSNAYLLHGGTQSKAQARSTWFAGQEAMRERAAVFQCYHCQQGKPIDHIDGGRAFHLDSKGCPTYCTGQDIRALPVE